MANPIFIIDIDPDGIVATHPRRVELPVLVAPIPPEQKGSHFNTIRPQLVAIGCFQLPAGGYAFDSSVIGPTAEKGFIKFAKLMVTLQKQDDQDPKRFPPVSVFAHADPTGDDPYNKVLSGRRALALYAVLVRRVDLWERLFSQPFGGDQWGTKSIQTMLSVSLKRPKGQPAEPPFYDGPIDGAKSKETKQQTDAAVKAYLDSRFPGAKPAPKSLDKPGDAKSRAVLFKDYMDALCHDSAGDAFILDAETDFLARRKDKENFRGDVQGCGEFNPVFLLSKPEEDLAKKNNVLAEVRNEVYVVNRRAIVYIFKHGSEIDPARWPCPAALDGPGACTLRFWSDEKKRRASGPDRREFGEKMQILAVDEAGAVTETPVEQTGNTMGCRFYHAFAFNSPCERKVKEWVVRFRIDSFNGKQEPLSFRRYVVKAGSAEFAPVIRGTTNEKGEIRIPVFDDKTTMEVKLDAFGEPKKLDDDAAAKPPAAQADGGTVAAGEASEPGFDTDAFEDEDTFWPLILDAGALNPRDVGDDLAIKQRLYNLGFGENPPETMDQTEFDRAMRAYRRRHKELEKADDATVRAKVLNEHDIEDPTPPAPEEQPT